MRAPAPVSYLRLIIGVFFIVIGVLAIIGRQSSSVIVGQDIVGVQIAFGIVELLGGISLIIGVLTSFRIVYIQVLNVVLFFVWLVKIVLNILSLAIPTFPATAGVSIDVTGWIVSFVLQLVILGGLYVAYRDYSLL